LSKVQEIKLFGKWSYEDIKLGDPGLQQYISLKPVYVPHSMGRHEHGKFHKAKVSIVERLINNLMRPGSCAGKKTRAITLVKNAFEIINIRTGENPVQVLVSAVENTSPGEDTTRISYGGIAYHMAVDISPQRRVDLALRFLSEGARKQSFGNPKALDEYLAEELIMAAKNDVKSFAVKKRNEMERIARSSR
jgi:small subunit ribosomal protein S7